MKKNRTLNKRFRDERENASNIFLPAPVHILKESSPWTWTICLFSIKAVDYAAAALRSIFPHAEIPFFFMPLRIYILHVQISTSHEYGHASVSREAERQSLPDFPRVFFRVVRLDDVGNKTVDETTDDVNLTAETRSAAVEMGMLKKEA